MKYVVILAGIFWSSTALSQDSDPIVTDRPTQSAAVSTVGKDQLLIESGFIAENTTAFQNYFNFNTLVRYGIGELVEVRLTANYDRISGDDFRTSGLGTTNLGAKVFITSADRAFADVSVIGQVNLPTGEANNETTGEIRFNFQNQLSNSFSLGYNLGVALSPEGENEVSPFYSVVLSTSVAKGWTVFAEPYGFLNEPADHRFNAGLTYLVTPNFQVDLSGGLGLSGSSPDGFIGFGFAVGL